MIMQNFLNNYKIPFDIFTSSHSSRFIDVALAEKPPPFSLVLPCIGRLHFRAASYFFSATSELPDTTRLQSHKRFPKDFIWEYFYLNLISGNSEIAFCPLVWRTLVVAGGQFPASQVYSMKSLNSCQNSISGKVEQPPRNPEEDKEM